MNYFFEKVIYPYQMLDIKNIREQESLMLIPSLPEYGPSRQNDEKRNEN